MAAKLLGVYLAYTGLIYSNNAFVFGDGSGGATRIQVLHAALAFVFAFVLVVRTDWLARLVGVSSEAPTSIGGAPVRILIEYVPLALAAFFVFRADRVVDLISRQKAPTG